MNKMAKMIYDKAYMHTKKEDEDIESLYGFDGYYSWGASTVDTSGANVQLPLGYGLGVEVECEHEVAIYDSGFKRYQYCKKCNKDLGIC